MNKDAIKEINELILFFEKRAKDSHVKFQKAYKNFHDNKDSLTFRQRNRLNDFKFSHQGKRQEDKSIVRALRQLVSKLKNDCEYNTPENIYEVPKQHWVDWIRGCRSNGAFLNQEREIVFSCSKKSMDASLAFKKRWGYQPLFMYKLPKEYVNNWIAWEVA